MCMYVMWGRPRREGMAWDSGCYHCPHASPSNITVWVLGPAPVSVWVLLLYQCGSCSCISVGVVLYQCGCGPISVWVWSYISVGVVLYQCGCGPISVWVWSCSSVGPGPVLVWLFLYINKLMSFPRCGGYLIPRPI